MLYSARVNSQMRIRAYRPKDELYICPNEYMIDWDNDCYTCKDDLRDGQAWTIESDGGSIEGIACFYATGSGMNVRCWMLLNDGCPAIIMRAIKYIVKKYLTAGFKLYTISISNDKQDRMHRFLGFECVRIIRGEKLWVKRGKV